MQPMRTLTSINLSAGLISILSIISVVLSSNSIYDRFLRDKFHYKSTAQSLRKCTSWQVCNKVDTYWQPWIDKQCQCGAGRRCSTSLNADDGHTIQEKHKQYKICESVKKLPICRFFKDITYVLTSFADNSTSQKMACICPSNSVSYIVKHEILKTPKGNAIKYLFACSPESREQCKPKEPCRLFTVVKRGRFEEVNSNKICDCDNDYYCPSHHRSGNVAEENAYPLHAARVYSGYCTERISNELSKTW